VPAQHEPHANKLKALLLPHSDTARLEALISSIGEGVIAADEKGQITRINQVALDILGFRRRDIIGRRFPETVVALHDNGKPIAVYDRPIAKAFLTGRTINAHTTYRRKDGSGVPIALTVSPIIFQGRPVGAIEVFRDLTEEKQHERMISDFISIASHQLRTPLSAINMYTHMLQNGLAGKLDEQQLAFTKIILTSVGRMNELIDTLLNITRIEAGNIAINTRPVRLDNLLREIIIEFLPSAEEKDITVVSDIPAEAPEIATDPLLVKEIYANLLSNAIKYTPSGGTATVELRVTPDSIRTTVRDTGYGIPEASQKFIFTKFFRAENITKQDVSGTGLGLYLTKTITENLGGELWFTSRENEGTAFTLSLPRAKA
jgi:PAS domain S-box-containing protein